MDAAGGRSRQLAKIERKEGNMQEGKKKFPG